MSELIITLSRLISMVIAFAGVAAVGFFVVGAFKYISSSGSSQKVEEAKESMKQALIGLVAVLVAFSLVNTIISQIGNTGGAISIAQLTGTDSGDLEGPYLVVVTEYGVNPTGSAWTKVSIRFSENIKVQGREKIFLLTRDYGIFPVDDVKDAEIIFDVSSGIHTAGTIPEALCPKSGDKYEYVVEGIVLGSGASIEDEDGNPARYVFSPTLVKFCEKP